MQGEFFDGSEYEQYITWGEKPPLTGDQLIEFTDDLADNGFPMLALDLLIGEGVIEIE